MKPRTPTVLAVSLGLALLLASCSHRTEITSGSQSLSRYPDAASGAPAEGTKGAATEVTDADIVAAADLEPALSFPARIGIARIDDGRFTALPLAEAAAWQKMGERLGPAWGDFEPLRPFIAAVANPGAPDSSCGQEVRGIIGATYSGTPPSFKCLRETAQNIRLGAARQDLDVVLIYESFGRSENSSNSLAITKLALIGFFLPTEDVEAEGQAQAVLVDVRSGYHYGSATAKAGQPVRKITTTRDVISVRAELQGEVRLAAVEVLTKEVERLVVGLRGDLEKRRRAKPVAR